MTTATLARRHTQSTCQWLRRRASVRGQARTRSHSRFQSLTRRRVSCHLLHDRRNDSKCELDAISRPNFRSSASETINQSQLLPILYANNAMGSSTYIVWPASALNEWAWMGGLETIVGSQRPSLEAWECQRLGTFPELARTRPSGPIAAGISGCPVASVLMRITTARRF